MSDYVLDLRELDQTQVAVAGGKGANLGELSRIEGIHVPPGFCVTTDAFRRFMAEGGERIPDDLAAAITARIREDVAYAVRSSATAEDSPSASFAGQHDSYLNVVGPAAILEHVRRCWASLFTERAVIYRQRNGIDHRKVFMAVVVQEMVDPYAAGVLFTADPVTGNRKVASIEATLGLGEALVSGRVNAKPVLTDAQAARLVQLGRRIEAHFGRPQDIEWCLADDDFHIVQSRPITTLFPIPEADDGENHVYVSVGHQQMMTDPMKPLGLSVWQLTTPRPMSEAGGRLFVDVTPMLASPATRTSLLETLGKSDPLIRDALESILARDFIPSLPDEAPAWAPPGGGSGAIKTDPNLVAQLIAASETSLAALKREIRTKSGPALLDFIRADIQELKRPDPRSIQVVMAGMQAAWWLNDQLQAWLGEKNVADTLTQSVPDNVTSEMGLALMDVADVIRPHPEVVAFLERVDDDGFLDQLPGEVRDAILTWLDKYGMRGVGEIDITRPRWSERPTMLVPLILGHVRNFEPGAAARRFEQGLQEAHKKEEELLERLRALPDGEQKAEETKRMIDRVRTFAGYREYPKYRMISRYFVYKQALMREADRLVEAGVLREREDIFFLRFEEIGDVVDDALIARRKEAFRTYQALTPPRVLTSDGEAISGSYRRDDVPAGALTGLAVSAGTVEGRARVILDIAEAELEAGDILVTAYTDPSWTPLFVSIKGLVTEVGGLMTHGAVIAREYGLPAVVGVERATRLIRDGQRIRVHGTEGYVEILSGAAGF
ncbi:MAG TPA: rifamycin-inactivating phosphotransferase [Thermoanaerobaculia bacterium]|nr:rifamycin-inactivating phosphotransferase [Thermoanaerobaculia bacterium]